MQAPQAQGQDVAAQLQSMLAQAALVQQLQAHQSAHSQLMQLLQLNQLVQGSTPDPSGERHATIYRLCYLESPVQKLRKERLKSVKMSSCTAIMTIASKIWQYC